MHWLENRGTVPAVEISVDSVRQQRAQARHLTRSGLPPGSWSIVPHLLEQLAKIAELALPSISGKGPVR
jgi:hypothetical protein